jgi:hypothetical protein
MLLTIIGIIFVLGFFIDWIEITIITLPLFLPVLGELDFADHAGGGTATALWMATPIALALQTSFLTPPFGLALFFSERRRPAGGQDHRYLPQHHSRGWRAGVCHRTGHGLSPAGQLAAQPGLRLAIFSRLKWSIKAATAARRLCAARAERCALAHKREPREPDPIHSISKNVSRAKRSG